MAFPLPAPPNGVAYAVTAASEIFNAIWSHAIDRSAEFDSRMDDTLNDVPASVTVPVPGGEIRIIANGNDAGIFKGQTVRVNITNLADREGSLNVVVGAASGTYNTFPIAPRQGFLTLMADF